MTKEQLFDFVITGSGFGGSILAMGLVQSGYNVCLIERDKHPRFSIGESSTPIADMVLRSISKKYNLPFLRSLSRYGTWQKTYPEITCGRKRGFSYYHHEKGKLFQSNKYHENELLVAASVNDENSDTNWFRSDIDEFFVKQCISLGVNYLDESKVIDVQRITTKQKWNIYLNKKSETHQVRAKWLIDATGSSAFSNKFLGTTSTSSGFETNSRAIYSHFTGVGEWQEYLIKNSFTINDYPYNPDFSALHHLIDEGWMWMLKFNDGLLSAGIVLDSKTQKENGQPEQIWDRVLGNYPSIKLLFKGCELANSPGKYINTNRLQRRLNKVVGDGWIALNHTGGFVDPLHSTGIAHTLVSVEKLLAIFSEKMQEKEVLNSIKNYQDEFYKELKFIDLIVSSSYFSRYSFPLFSASVMLYFIASIRYEQQRLKSIIPDTFLCAGDTDLLECIFITQNELKILSSQSPSKEDILEQIDKIKQRITPYNSAGLLDPQKNNMYTHTAVAL